MYLVCPVREVRWETSRRNMVGLALLSLKNLAYAHIRIKQYRTMRSVMGRQQLICLGGLKLWRLAREIQKKILNDRYLLWPYPSMSHGETVSPIFFLKQQLEYFISGEICLGREFSYTNHTASHIGVPGNPRQKWSWMYDVLLVLSSKVSSKELPWNAVTVGPWGRGLRTDPATRAGAPLPPCGSALLGALQQHPPKHPPAPTSQLTPPVH